MMIFWFICGHLRAKSSVRYSNSLVPVPTQSGSCQLYNYYKNKLKIVDIKSDSIFHTFHHSVVGDLYTSQSHKVYCFEGVEEPISPKILSHNVDCGRPARYLQFPKPEQAYYYIKMLHSSVKSPHHHQPPLSS